MRSYIESVLEQVYLPASVKSEVEAELRGEFERAARLGEAEPHIAERLGDSRALAERYNLSYKTAVQKRISVLNAGVALLVCFILLLSGLFLKQAFDYAQERLNWYLYQTYVSGMAGFQNRQPQNPRALQQSPGFAGNPQPRSARKRESYEFKTTVRLSAVCFYAGGIFLCAAGINYMGYRKSKLKSSKLYIDILPVITQP